MDEPKRSAAAASSYLVLVALGLLLVGYVWPEHGQEGTLTITYSRLLGIRIEGTPLPLRQTAAIVVSNLAWLVVLVASLRAVTPRKRAFVLGGAALLGVFELLHVVTVAVFGEFLGVSVLWLGVGGLLLVVAAIGALTVTEIQETEETRA